MIIFRMDGINMIEILPLVSDILNVFFLFLFFEINILNIFINFNHYLFNEIY